MDVTGKPLRIHARVFDVAEERVAQVELSAGEHDEFAWVPPDEIAPLDLAAHFRL